MIPPTPELVIRQYMHESLVHMLFGIFGGLVPAAVFIGCLYVVDTRADDASFVTSSVEVGLHAQSAVPAPEPAYSVCKLHEFATYAKQTEELWADCYSAAYSAKFAIQDWLLTQNETPREIDEAMRHLSYAFMFDEWGLTNEMEWFARNRVEECK